MKTDAVQLKYRLCQINTACTKLPFGRSFLVVDFLPSTLALQCRLRKDGRGHSIKAIQLYPAKKMLRAYRSIVCVLYGPARFYPVG